MIVPSDILLKTAIEAALNDLRANPWILDDIFGGLAADPMSRADYGYKHVKAAKDWFLSNDIPVLLQFRIADNPPIPCITIAYGDQPELEARANLGDQGFIQDYDPEEHIIVPQKVYDNFTPKFYDPATGLVTFPDGITNELVANGQVLVSKRSGKYYTITEAFNNDGFYIPKNIKDNFTECFIAPKSILWNMHKELTFVSDQFTIACHAQSDPAVCIWLWQIMVYSLLRYKEAFLESRGFELSSFRSSGLERNPQFEVENVFSRYITITGQVQLDWIKFIAPKLQKTIGNIVIQDGPETPNPYKKDVKEQGWIMEGDFQAAQEDDCE